MAQYYPQQNLLNPRDDVITVGTTVTEMSPQMTNKQRTVLVLTNTSTGGQVISLGFGKDAVAGRGLVLSPGGIWNEGIDAAYLPTDLRITAVSSAAGGTLAIHERFA